MKKRNLLFFLLIALDFFGGKALATEEAKFAVLKKDGAFELRRYDAQIVAETLVAGEFKEVGNEGFRRLFRYISGGNRTQQSISMTAPVTQEGGSEKIAMTAPVSQEKSGGEWRITFLMPSSYTLQTLPEPLDPKVQIKEVPGRYLAAVTYSGTWSQTRYEEHKALLVEWMATQGLKPTGGPVWARYNPPFTPWFLRKNEILIPVEAP
ncbi:MAG: heme-binding protein [Deltaproteobacteria bacterium]|nr:MAG: heme-binding protein [Deltaproteobacteria bacterium]